MKTLEDVRTLMRKWCEDPETLQILRWHEALNQAERLRDYSQREMAREILDGLHVEVEDDPDELIEAMTIYMDDSEDDLNAFVQELEQFIREAKAE